MKMSPPKTPKDILKEIQAESLGVSPEDVVFTDLRKKKKKKKKIKKTIESESDDTIISNQEGFSITNMGTEVCSYGDIGKKRRLKQKNSLEEWGAFDFFLFTQKKYINRYGSNWDLNIGGSSLEINRIRDKFYDLFGFCCNLIMRDYIDFFFDNYMDDLIRTEGEFFFNHMRRDKMMCEFYDGYNFPQSFEKYTKSEKLYNKVFITSQEVREAFLIGDTSLVSNYGVVISLNWLIVVKKMSALEATMLVVMACKDMFNKGMINVVQNVTELYSPYPSNIPFKSPQLVMNKIDKNIKLSVEFVDNDKLRFLQRKGDK